MSVEPRTNVPLVEASRAYVWDTGLLDWVVMTQPGGGGGGAGDASAANQTTEIARLTSILAQLDVALSTRTKPADQQHTIIDSSAAIGVTGPLTDAQLRASAVPTSLATLPALIASAANIGDVDVLTVPADPFGANADAVVAAGAVGSIQAKLRRLTQGIEDLKTLTVLAAGANAIGKLAANSGVDIGDVDVTSIVPPTLTKGTQGATGFSTQDLKDAGRNVTNYFMAAGVAGTNAEVMQSLTGYKGGVAVGATVTPAVVTSGKIFRVTSITLSYQSLATAGACLFRLRANLTGAGVVGSPLVCTFIIGSAAAVAGITTTEVIPIPDGLEFAAGAGIAVGMLGLSTVGAALAAGFGTITINGYEY